MSCPKILNIGWVLIVVHLNYELINAQVCTDNGKIVGLDISGIGGFDNSTNTIILDEYGDIDCYGVVTEWQFTKKDTECAGVYFQIWRPDPNTNGAFQLIGWNLYDGTTEACSSTAKDQLVRVRIPKDKQIPVEPEDVIGWTSLLPNRMIKYISRNAQQNVIEVCKSQPAITLGFNTKNCSDASVEPRDVSLKAIVATGPAPIFANLPAIVEIPENTMHNTPSKYPARWYDVKASISTNDVMEPISVDEPNHLDVPLTFSFATPQMYFNITSEEIDDNLPNTGRVTLLQPLDFETQQEHILPIRVDGLGQSSESTLTVKVIDLNEPHVITNLPFTTSVNAETATIGDTVFRIEIWDEDVNTGPLIYAIDATNELEPPPPFKMDVNTGILTVSEDLASLDLPHQYILDLSAWDSMHKAFGELTINLEDIRTGPQISNLPFIIELPEDVPTGSEIYQVAVDARFPDEIEYQIIAVYPFEMYNKFTIDQHNGRIITTGATEFNYGDKNQHPITIEVLVRDSVGNDTKPLTVHLSWINRQPMFRPSVYAIDIPEKCGWHNGSYNYSIPWTIEGLNLHVDHRDEGVLPDDGRTIDTSMCSIVPSFASSMFEMVGCTELNVIGEIDVNAHPELMTINLTLLVEDNYGLSDTANVYITVHDINDHRPYFSPSNYYETIKENTPGGKSLSTVTAFDDDFGENGTLYYTLEDIRPHNGTKYFQIDPLTGEIYTKQPVDYELLMLGTSSDVIQLRVRAWDRGSPQMKSHNNVYAYITIVNANDNRPGFDCVSQRRGYDEVDPAYNCFYDEEMRSDSVINFNFLNLTAYDVENFVPTFYFLNPMRHFGLDTVINKQGNYIGKLYTTAQPLLEYYKYMMICMVEDQGDPNLKARPPAIVRVDTYPPEKHLVDITVNETFVDFTVNQEAFMDDLYEYIKPWVPKLESFAYHRERTVVTIFALKDNSTSLYENLNAAKEFVHVNDLLLKLRKNINGVPRDSFVTATNESCTPILVMPTMPNWWIHTFAGLFTIFFLLLLLLLFLIIATILLCKRFHLCCYKKKTKVRPTTHAWMKDMRYLQNSKVDLRTIEESDEEDGRPETDYARSSDDDGNCDVHPHPGTSARRRANSASTIHSRIYVMSPRPTHD